MKKVKNSENWLNVVKKQLKILKNNKTGDKKWEVCKIVKEKTGRKQLRMVKINETL